MHLSSWIQLKEKALKHAPNIKRNLLSYSEIWTRINQSLTETGTKTAKE